MNTISFLIKIYLSFPHPGINSLTVTQFTN